MSAGVILVIVAAASGISVFVALVMMATVMREMVRAIHGMARGSEGYKEETTGKTGIISPYRKQEHREDEGK